MAKFKKGDAVRLPTVYTEPDVIKIIVETVDDVTGVVETVKLIKKHGKPQVMDVTNIIVTSVNIIARIIAWFDRLFRKK